jgi:O-acetyl-ADP-ribose deacetylase (regulator of RNase III)
LAVVLAFQIPSLLVQVTGGDLAEQHVDAVVNAANTHFIMGAGVAGALKAKGGSIVEDEAIALGPAAPGDCVVTSGGQLPAPHVIHAAVMGLDLLTSAPIIERATRNALLAAEERRFASVAFPALGTGVGGFPMAECATIMVSVVRAHAARSIKLVRFVLFGQAAYRAFAAAASAQLGEGEDLR